MTSWYAVQPRPAGSFIEWDAFTPVGSTEMLDRKAAIKSNKMKAKELEEVLLKRIAYVSGGKDRYGRFILTIPNIRDPYPYAEIDVGLTFRYMATLQSSLTKNKGFAVILDARFSSWSAIKPIVRYLQYYIPDEISYLYIVKPEDFWHKQKTTLSYKKYRDAFGYETALVSFDKLTRYIDKNQLTRQFGGWLYYNHNEWIRNRIVIEQESNNNNVIQRHEVSTTEPESEYMSDSGHVSAGTPTSNSTSSWTSKKRNRLNSRIQQSQNRVNDPYNTASLTSSRARSTSPTLRANRRRFSQPKQSFDNPTYSTQQSQSARNHPPSPLYSPSEKSVASLPTTREKLFNMPAPLRHKHRSHDDILSGTARGRSPSNSYVNVARSSDALSEKTLTGSPNRSSKTLLQYDSSSPDITQNNNSSVKRRRNRNSQQKDMRRRTLMGMPRNGPSQDPLNSSGGVIRSTSLGNVAKDKVIFTPEKIERGLRNVYDWVVGIGEQSLQSQLSVGDSLSTVQNLIHLHKVLINKAKEVFNLVPDMKIQITKIKHQQSPLSENDAVIISQLMESSDAVTKTCNIFQRKLDRRSNILAHSLAYYQSYEKVTKTTNVLISLCKGEASLIDTRENIVSALYRLKEYRETSKMHFAEFKTQAQEFWTLLEKEQQHPYISSKYLIVSYVNEIRFVHWSLSEVERKVKSCSENENTSNKLMNKVLQLKSAEEDVAQTISWLCELTDSIKHQHYALGTNPNETDNLRQQHDDIKVTAKRAYDDGNTKLSAISVLRRTLDLGVMTYNRQTLGQKKTSSSNFLLNVNGEELPSLEDAWKMFFQAWGERSSRLAVAYLFHLNSEKVIKRASQLEVDLDKVLPVSFTGSLKRRGRDLSFGSSKIKPLKDAQENLHQEMEHVLSVGNSLLKDATSSNRSYGCPDTSAIKTTIEHLDFLRSSLHSKWSKVNKRKSSGSRSSSSSWMESVKDSTDWLRIKLVEYSPCSCVIGKNLKEAEQLMEEHRTVQVSIQIKQDIIEELLKKVEDFSMDEEDDITHRAMAKSLADMWREINLLQKQRHHVLKDSISFYKSADEFSKHLTFLEQYLNWNDLPRDKFSAESFLQTHEEMHTNMLQASQECLTQGKCLLNQLKDIKVHQPDDTNLSYGGACLTIECTLEELIDRRRQVEHRYSQRKLELEESVHTCEWESEVIKIISWFQNIKAEESKHFHLGNDLNGNQLAQSHIHDVKLQVKTRKDKAKQLLKEASERLSMFGNEPITARATQLDKVVEDLLSYLDKQKELLTDAGRFYEMLNKTLASLESIANSLENVIFPTDLEDLEIISTKYVENVDRSTGDTENFGKEIVTQTNQLLSTLKLESNPSEGIFYALQNLNSRKEVLYTSIMSQRESCIRINEMSGLYFRNCQELGDWITKSAGEMLWSNPSLGSRSEGATHFLSWHRGVMEEVQRKKVDLDSLLQTANVLLESGVSHPNAVKDRAEEMKADWARLNRNVKKRIELAETFLQHLQLAQEVLEELRTMLQNVGVYKQEDMRNLEEGKKKELEETLQKNQEKSLEVLDQSTFVISKLKEREDDDNLETEASVEACESIAADIRGCKDNLLDFWLTWQYRDGVEKDANIHWQTIESTSDRLINALENLHMTIFEGGKVRLGFDSDSVEYLVKMLSDRQMLLHSINGEIEKLVKFSEMLSVRSPLNKTNTSFGVVHSKMIKSLISHHKILREKLRHYGDVLQLSKQWHVDYAELELKLRESEKEILEAKRMAVTTQPKKETYVMYLLRNHDNVKREIDDLLVSVANSERHIAGILYEMKLQEEADDNQMLLSEKMNELVDKHRKWREMWEDHNQTLCFQLDTAWYNNESRKQYLVLDEFKRKTFKAEKKLTQIKSKKEASEFVNEFQKLSGVLKNAYESSESFIPLARDRMTRQEGKEDEVNKNLDQLRKEWSGLKKNSQEVAEKSRQKELYFTISVQCEGWQMEISRRISALKQRLANSTSIEERNNVAKMLGEICFEEQEERIVAMQNISKDMNHTFNYKDTLFTENINEIRSEVNTIKKKIIHEKTGGKISFAPAVNEEKPHSASPKKFVFVPKSSFPPPGILKKSKPFLKNISEITKVKSERNHKNAPKQAPSVPPPPPPPKSTTEQSKKLNDRSRHHQTINDEIIKLDRAQASWVSHIEAGEDGAATDTSEFSSSQQSEATVKAARQATPDSFTSVTADEIDESITESTITMSDGEHDGSTATLSTLQTVSDDSNRPENNYIEMMGNFVPVAASVQAVNQTVQGKSKSPPSPPPRKYGSLRYKIKNRDKVKI